MPTEREAPVASYWRRTLGFFLGRPVRVVLQDGRERRGMLSESGGTFRVWTEDGPATIPAGSVASVEQV